MMTINTDESQNIEFKESWNDKYLQWICGFANAQGGRIYIGVNDSREVVGVDNPKKLMEDIPNKIVNYLGLVCDVNLIEDDGVEYIEIKVEPSFMPISYQGKFHYRSGSTKQELNGLALHQFLLKKFNLSWDSLVQPSATLNDIDEKAVSYFVRRAVEHGRLPESCKDETVEEVLRRLHVMTQEGQLTMAALLLFGKDIEQWCPLAIFRIGRFGTDEADLMYSDNISCPLIMMPSRVLETLRSRYLIAPIKYEGVERIEPLEIPEDALREMVCNSIVHKLYQSTFIHMKVWNDHITIWNPGTLPDGFTVETLMQPHESYPRNKLIANVFYLAGLIESWGRGYYKIRSGFESAGLRVPSFDVVRGGVLATIDRELFVKQNYESSCSNVPISGNLVASSDNLVASSDNLVASSEKKEWESYKDICERIIRATVDWSSLNEISNKVGRNPKYLRNKIIPRMISEGKLLLKYPDTPKHPNQKYRGVYNV